MRTARSRGRLFWGGGVCPEGICPGGCLPRRVSAWGASHTPVDIRNDTSLWKNYLSPTTVAGGNEHVGKDLISTNQPPHIWRIPLALHFFLLWSLLVHFIFILTNIVYGVILSAIFFLKFLLDTCPFLGPLIPLFRTSGDVSSGFQSQSGQPYSNFVEAYIPWDSPVVRHLYQCIWPA